MSDGASSQRLPPPSEIKDYAEAVHYASIALVVACPILALLPPRKLDFYTFGLVGTATYSANFLIQERTGRSVWQHVRGTNQIRNVPMDMSAQQMEARDAMQRERQDLLLQDRPAKKAGIVEQVQEMREEDERRMRREEEAKEAIENGGLGDMIMDRIWEVWNWGKPKDEDDD